MLSFAPLLVAALLLAPRISTPALDAGTEAAVLDAPTRHIRTMDAPIRKLLKRGVRHSPSFAALVTRLQDSDVYVYVVVLVNAFGSELGLSYVPVRAWPHGG